MLNTWFSMTDPMWKDFDRVKREIEQLFDLGAPEGNIRGVVRGTFPAINVGETEDEILVYVFAPGIDPAKAELTLEKNLLTIVAERDTSQEVGGEPEQQGYHRRERFSGRFRRVVTLPEAADPNKVEATYSDGILKVAVGKKEEERARKIDVSLG